MYIAILYYMADYYDNYENCEKYLIEHGYTRYKCNVLVMGALFSVMYIKDSDRMEINLLYGKSGEWCNMTCSVNYSGKMGASVLGKDRFYIFVSCQGAFQVPCG